MTHYGVISPPVSGHIHPFSALGRELVARGHQVTYLQVADLEEKICGEGLDFEAVGLSDHPRGSLPESLATIGKLDGLAALRFTIDKVAKTTIMMCRDAPEVIRRRHIDALLVDQMEPAGGAIAEHLGLPFVTVCNALAINRDPIAPPPFTPWRYHPSPLARVRNAVGYAISNRLTAPVSRAVAEYRGRWKLPALRSPDDSFSSLAQICQMPRELDFPRSALPASFSYVGPIRRAGIRDVPFPWDRLDGRSVVYASLGTLQNSRASLFRVIAEACQPLGVQLVLTHGGGMTEAQVADLPGDPLVVPYAPQEQLLARASLTITHAGLNTVLDSLTHGVPLVAIPITYEQPAIARRLEWSGAGKILNLRGLTAVGVRAAAAEVLAKEDYARSARRLAGAILKAGGVGKAAVIVESVLAGRGVQTPTA